MNARSTSMSGTKERSFLKPKTTSKLNHDTFLPKINKTTFLTHQNNQSTVTHSLYTTKINWILQQKDYSQLTNQDILDQYNDLRTQLLNLNEAVIKAIKKSQTHPHKLKTLDKQKDPTKKEQLKQREIQNNQYILELHRKEYTQLAKRLDNISNINTKKDLDQQMDNLKQQIHTIKDKIKNLKIKTNKIGNNIIKNDDIFFDIKQLEIQKDNQEKRYQKFQQKIKNSLQAIKDSQNKINTINNSYQISEKFFINYNVQQSQNFNLKQATLSYNHKKQFLQVLKKSLQSTIQQKQHKYHQVLKQYQIIIEKQENTNKKIQQTEVQILEHKNTIQYLQSKLKEQQKKLKDQQKNNTQNYFLTQGKINTYPQKKTINFNDKKIQQFHKINQQNSLKSKLKISCDQQIKENKQQHLQDSDNQNNQLINQVQQHTPVEMKKFNIDLSPVNKKIQQLKIETNFGTNDFFNDDQ